MRAMLRTLEARDQERTSPMSSTRRTAPVARTRAGTPRTAVTAGKVAAKRPRGATDKHDDRLTQILKTAANLFAEHGYESTSLETIAERLDMHKATLYHYVSGKEQILFLCQSRSFADLEDVYEHVQDTSRPVLERLRFFAVHLAHAQHTEFGRCLVRVGPKPLAEAAGGEIRKVQRRLDTIVRDLLKEGMATGELRQLDPALCGAMLFGALNWVPRWFKPEGRYSVDDVANGFFDIFEDGVRARTKARVKPTKPSPAPSAARSRTR